MEHNVVQQIKNIANNYNIQKVVLFGSRARGDHSPLSDYNIAIFGDANVKDDLLGNIMKDGVMIYEQIAN